MPDYNIDLLEQSNVKKQLLFSVANGYRSLIYTSNIYLLPIVKI